MDNIWKPNIFRGQSTSRCICVYHNIDAYTFKRNKIAKGSESTILQQTCNAINQWHQHVIQFNRLHLLLVGQVDKMLRLGQAHELLKGFVRGEHEGQNAIDVGHRLLPYNRNKKTRSEETAPASHQVSPSEWLLGIHLWSHLHTNTLHGCPYTIRMLNKQYECIVVWNGFIHYTTTTTENPTLIQLETSFKTISKHFLTCFFQFVTMPFGP